MTEWKIHSQKIIVVGKLSLGCYLQPKLANFETLSPYNQLIMKK